MNIIKYESKRIPKLKNTAVALGFFDGVHMAHRELIKTTLRAAKEQNLTPVVFSFTAEGGIKSGTPRLYSTEERLYIFEKLGVENVVLVDFETIKELSAEEFVKELLVKELGARIAVAGYNFRFGCGALGDSEMLKALMEESGGKAMIANEISSLGRTISATLIRSALADGDIELANSLLSTPFFISGRVEHGNKVGKTLGFPTINIPLTDGAAAPARGVYITGVVIGDKIYTGLTNVGTCPTFNERKMHTETYILDYCGDIYGSGVKIFFLEFLREERKFESPKELQDEINKNIKSAKERGNITWAELGLK